MMFSHRHVLVGLAASGMLVVSARALQAQTCNGTPRRGGIAYEQGKVSAGDAPGVSAAIAGGRTALGVFYRSPDAGDDATAYEGGLRFSLLFGAGKLLICPGLGVNYAHEEWTPSSDITVTNHTLSLNGGVGVGLEQPVGKDFAVIPFAGLRYFFDAKAFEIDASGDDNETTGDTLSHMNLELGALVRFKFLYAGYMVNRFTDEDENYLSRVVVGITFGSGGAGKSSKQKASTVAADRQRRLRGVR